MDEMDRLLERLPEEGPSPELATTIILAVHRRHRRRQIAREIAASFLGLLGLWLAWPGISWLSSNELFASGTPWLLGGLNYVNGESLDTLNRLWNTAFSAQTAIGSSIALSVWLGALLVCGAIFLALDARSWQPARRPRVHGGGSTMLASSLHG
ncbi:MAG TPA: hypothetical protein VF784_02950 [Anaerolineales bacterium]